jgi:plastocyanin
VIRHALLLGLAALALGLTPVSVDVTGVTRVGGKPTMDAVVWLDVPDAPRARSPRPAVLDQRDVQFYPHVLAVQVGTRVKFPNDDRVFHNVFSFHDGEQFDLGLYPVGIVKDVPFDRPGLSRIFCNIHPKMAAYVMVVDTPFYAVSDDTGRFTIPSVPQGRYAYHAWRSGGEIINDHVTIEPGRAFQVRWP